MSNKRLRRFESLEVRNLLSASPIYESFESGLSSDWTVSRIDADAQVEVRSLADEGIIDSGPSLSFTENGNSSALVFDSSRDSGDFEKDLGLAIWNVDLTEFTRGLLTFHHFEIGDVPDLLPDAHTTTTPGDGISVSVNGTDWYRLLRQNGLDFNRDGDSLWELIEIDLASEFARINAAFPSANLSFGPDLQLKFSQFGSLSLPDSGFAIDEIRITDASEQFSLGRPRGAFHRFAIAGLDETDYFYRVGLFGDVDADTPVLVSTHGLGGAFRYSSQASRWHRFVADPSNEVTDLIVLTPAFPDGGLFEFPEGFNQLSWNDEGEPTADLALLDTLDALAASGVGDVDDLHMWGFSAGAQFTHHFSAAYTDRVAAIGLGGTGSHLLPVENFAWPHGFGPIHWSPPPAEANLDLNAFLQQPVLYWIGENDRDQDVELFGDTFNSFQGENRIEMALNSWESVYTAIDERAIASSSYLYELVMKEDEGHNWSDEDAATVYEFLFRDHNTEEPVRIHPRIVKSATPNAQVRSLPDNVNNIEKGESFFVELWIESADSAVGVKSGQLDLYFDPQLATLDPAQIDHGIFDQNSTASYDEENAPAFVRSFGGTTVLSDVGKDDYALFGRFALTAAVPETAKQLTVAMTRSTNAPIEFELEDSSLRRTDFLPFAKTTVGADVATIQGTVFDDQNGNGIQDAEEVGLPNRTVSLSAGSEIGRGVEPDDFPEFSYLNSVSPWVELSSFGNLIINSGVFSTTRNEAAASTGTNIFSSFGPSGFTPFFNSSRASLRADFKSPVSKVSIDAIGLPTGQQAGRLEVYDANDNLLEAISLPTIGGVPANLEIQRPEGDIAYAVATGDGNFVRLDNLQFELKPSAKTDEFGNYFMPDIAPGSYDVEAELPPGWEATVPATNVNSVVVDLGEVQADIDFGQRLSADADFVIAVSGDETTEAGGSQTLSVSLTVAPTSVVVLPVESSDVSEGVASQSSLIFTPLNWNEPQQLTVTGVDDAILDGDVEFLVITNPATSNDARYEGLDPPDFVFTNLDDDAIANLLHFSLSSDDVENSLGLSGDTATDRDVITASTTGFSLLFDGSDVGIPSEITALAILSETELLLSLRDAGNIPGIEGLVEISDIIKFTATSLGENTQGTFELFFDGSDVNLASFGENIDALDVLPNGDLLMSFVGRPAVPNVGRQHDEDILRFTPTALGADTTGTWSFYFDGGDVGYDTNQEDIDGLAVSVDDVFLSTTGPFNVPGLSGGDEDVSIFAATQLGETTTGSFQSIYFDGSSVLPSRNDISGFDLPIGFGGNLVREAPERSFVASLSTDDSVADEISRTQSNSKTVSSSTVSSSAMRKLTKAKRSLSDYVVYAAPESRLSAEVLLSSPKDLHAESRSLERTTVNKRDQANQSHVPDFIVLLDGSL